MNEVADFERIKADRARRDAETAPVIDIGIKQSLRQQHLERVAGIESLRIPLAVYVADNLTKEYAAVIGNIVDQEDLVESLSGDLCKLDSADLHDGERLAYYGVEDEYKEFAISNGLIVDMAHTFKEQDAGKSLEIAALYTAGFIVGSLAVTGTIGSLELAKEGSVHEYAKTKESLDPHRFAAGILYEVSEDRLNQPDFQTKSPLHYQGLSLPMDKSELNYTASRLYC